MTPYASFLTPDQRTRLLPLYAAEMVAGHVPRPEDDYGYTCDERGCVICNGGDEAIDWILEDLTGRASSTPLDSLGWPYPCDEELIDAATDYVTRLAEEAPK